MEQGLQNDTHEIDQLKSTWLRLNAGIGRAAGLVRCRLLNGRVPAAPPVQGCLDLIGTAVGFNARTGTFR